MDSSLAG
jgi:hypothetical protein